MVRSGSPLRRGAGLAVLAALAFGVTTPIIERAGRGVGPLATAALLYAGALLSAALVIAGRRRDATATASTSLTAHAGRLVLVALLGAGLAPALLAWGLQRIGATTGSLLLNLEALFTVFLARMFLGEALGRRVLFAVSLMLAGGVVLAVAGARAGGWSAAGVLAVAAATFAWSLDNTLTRPLAELDAVRIVAAKAGLGAGLTFVVALVRREPLPSPGPALVLLACGATGYGLSLQLYLLAQRHIGAARTGSIFACAPFIGAAVAWALGDRAASPLTALAAGLFAAGVAAHVTERHAHRHRHDAVAHEHPHRHDDGHHGHVHDPPIAGAHTHAHQHEALDHDHEHAPDLHHAHDHATKPGAG